MSDLSGLSHDAQADQSAAALRTIGSLVGAYWAGLVAAGLSGDASDLLARDYAYLFWHKNLYPEYPPMVLPE